MAFKPIVIEKEIDGRLYKAQFNGVSAMFDATKNENSKELVEYLFKNVVVSPRIDDMDEYFGIDVEHMNKVVEFAGEVMRADKKYFPAPDGSTAKGKSKE